MGGGGGGVGLSGFPQNVLLFSKFPGGMPHCGQIILLNNVGERTGECWCSLIKLLKYHSFHVGLP